MAEDPTIPGGPSNQQPPTTTTTVDPGLADVMARMANAQEIAAASAAKIEEHLKKAAANADDVTKNLNTTKLQDMVEIFDSAEEAIKEIATHAKKLRQGVFNTKNAQDAVKAAHQIVEAQKEMLKKTKENTIAFQSGSKSIQQLEGFVNKFGKRVGQLNKDEMREFLKVMHDAELSGDKLLRKFKDMKLSHVSRQLNSLGKVIAPGATANIEARRKKHADRMSDLTEHQRSRLGAGRATADDRRARAITEMKTHASKNPSLAKAMLTPSGELDMGSENVRKMLASKMGFRGNRAKTFSAGEQAMSMGSNTGGKAYEALMETGGGGAGGMMSELATVIEDLGVGIEGALAAFAPEIEIAVLAISALVEAFESFTKQNKEMESSLGKGGLFTQGGDAFASARSNLNPRGSGFSQLGVSFERNLKIAGAIANSGASVRDLVTGGPDTANAMPGARGEFMSGGIGQIQRIAMGAGRVSGMSDTEAVETTMKNMQQYGATLESTEKFFIQINKDTKAAGISTTKYISLIDDVSSHFDRMNKSLEITMGLLRQLSRTGAVGSEDLKDMLDFLSANNKTDFGNVANKAFLQQQYSPEMNKALLEGQKGALSGLIDSSADSLQNIFGPGSAQMKKLQSVANMPIEQAQQAIASLQYDVSHAVDENGKPITELRKQAAMGGLNKVGGQLIQVQSAKERGLGRAAASTMFGENMGGTAADNLTRVMAAASKSGINIQDILTGKVVKGGGTRELEFGGIMQQIMGTSDVPQAVQAFTGIAKQTGTRRLDEAMGNKDLARALVKELAGPHNKGIRMELLPKGKTVQDLLQNGDLAQNFLKDNAQELTLQTGSLKGTLAWLIAKGGVVPKTSNEEQSAALDEARRIGRQTQGIEDAIKNALSKWMTKLVGGIEWIVDHWIWGSKGTDPQAERKDLQGNYNLMQGQIPSMSDTLEKAMAKNRYDAAKSSGEEQDKLDKQYMKMKDSSEFLKGINDQGTFMSKEQVDQAHAIQKDLLTMGSKMPDTPQGYATVAKGEGAYNVTPNAPKWAPNSALNINGLLDSLNDKGGGKGGTTINKSQTNIYSANVNQHLATPSTVSDSGEKVTSTPMPMNPASK